MFLKIYFSDFRRWLKKNIGPPSPIELGKSKSNALPMREFTPETKDYTWEDWREEVKRDYPVRYFIAETVPHKVSVKIIMPIDHFFYWIKSRFIRKNHLLDLRQPKTGTSDDYEWGWLEHDQKLVLGCFTALKHYMEDAERCPTYGPDDKSIAELEELLEKEKNNEEDCYATGTENFIKTLKEVKEIWNYWTVERKQQLKYMDYLIRKAYGRNSRDKQAQKEHSLATQWFYQIEEEMLIRLIKIRSVLWS